MKPIVLYDIDQSSPVTIGISAYVQPLDHPNCSNTKLVKTSKVISYNPKTKDFETENTCYVAIRRVYK